MMRLLLLFCLLAVPLVGPVPATPARADDVDDWAARSAGRLKDGLRAALADDDSRPVLLVNLNTAEGASSGVEAAAARLQDALVARLTDRWRARFRLLTSESLGASFAELRRSALDDPEAFQKLLDASAADLLLDLDADRADDRSVRVRGRLVTAAGGDLLAQLPAVQVSLGGLLDKPSSPLKSNSDLVRAVSADIADAGLASPLRVAGVFYQSSRLQAGYSSRLLPLLIAGLGERLGSDVRAPTSTAPREAATYSLTYWPGTDRVLLIGQLRMADGQERAWEYSLSLDAAGPGLEPAAGSLATAQQIKALPTRFQLTTDRGNRPVYRIGDVMTFRLDLRYGSYVDCYYQQADGSVLKIFPNQFHQNNYLPQGSEQMLPSDQMPFEFTASAPAGSEFVECFASPQNLGSILPQPLRTPALGAPVGMGLVAIQEEYDRLSGGRSEMASLVLNVVN